MTLVFISTQKLKEDCVQLHFYCDSRLPNAPQAYVRACVHVREREGRYLAFLRWRRKLLVLLEQEGYFSFLFFPFFFLTLAVFFFFWLTARRAKPGSSLSDSMNLRGWKGGGGNTAMAVVAAAAAGVSVSIWEGKRWRFESGLGVVQAEEAIEQRRLGRKGMTPSL